MTRALVIGANKKIGYEIAKGLRPVCVDLIVGARDRRCGEEATAAIDADLIQLDVNDGESVARAAADVERGRDVLDILVNNAGTLLELGHRDPYNTSKTALNAVTLQYACALRVTAVRINAVVPGHSATDISRLMGDRPPAEAARRPIRLGPLPDDGPTGASISNEGEVPW